MSWMCEVYADNEWVSNGLRFETEKEAVEYGYELLSRWTKPKESRAVENTDPVNYRFDFDEYRAVPLT